MEAKKFKIGKKYFMRSACDYDCIWTFKVVKRTKCTITIVSDNEQLTRRVSVFNGGEYCNPFGRYSMAPVLTAQNMVKR